jgi:hypothetical protein
LIITGTVTRKPGVHDVIAGRIDVDIFASNGDELAWLPCLLTPDPVPDDQTSQSTYEMHYGLGAAGRGRRCKCILSTRRRRFRRTLTTGNMPGGGYGGGGGGQAAIPAGTQTAAGTTVTLVGEI